MSKKDLGDFLRKKRKELGKKQEDVTREIGSKQASVSSWENGKYYPNSSNMPKIAKAYGVTVKEMEDLLKKETPQENRTGLNILPLLGSIVEAKLEKIEEPEFGELLDLYKRLGSLTLEQIRMVAKNSTRNE